MITLIVAKDRNGAIGRRNEIPWRASEDISSFKSETIGGAVIMGRNTWKSLPAAPLPGRTNCVISRDKRISENVFDNIEDAVDFCYSIGHQRIYGIGGHGIYEALLPIADRLLLTEVAVEVVGADTWFPSYDESMWREARQSIIRETAPRCRLRELLRSTGSNT